MSLTAPAQGSPDAATRPAHAIQGRGPWRLAWERLRRDPAAIASATAILLLAAMAVTAPAIAHAVGHGPDDQYHDIGLAAGYFGGVVDLVLARFMDVVLSFPYLPRCSSSPPC